MNDSYEFRELIRIMERKLGLLNKQGGCCYKVSLAQCHALVEIGRATSISLKELAILLNVDISTMSRTVDNLVKKDYVVRLQSNKDKRNIDIKLTDKGDNIFKNIENKMNNKFKNIFEEISENDRNIVINSLKVVIEALSKENNIKNK